MSLYQTTIRLLCVAALLTATHGCASDSKKQQSSKEQATAQWASARASVMHSLARDQFQTGSFDKARQTCDDALKIDPTNINLHILSSRIAIEQNRLDTADNALQQARKLDAKNAEALYLSGIVSQRWQRYPEALDYYTQAADAQPSELAYLLARAETLVRLERRTEAKSILQEKVVFFEHSSAIRDAVGQLLMQEQKYEAAIELFRQASILASEDTGVRERLALAYFQAGHFRDAADALARLVAVEPYSRRADLYVALGESYLATQKLLDARGSFQTATEIDPSSSQAWLGLTKAALSMNDLRRAEIVVFKTIALANDRSESHLALGYLRLKQERYSEAGESFRRATLLNADDPVALCMVGYVLDQQGRHQEALSFYGQALRVSPKDPLATQLMSTARIE
jgi:tetratricopeptide (TPR) repeat protein